MKKPTFRKCVATNSLHSSEELLRVVKSNDGEVKVDPTYNAPGRGAYILRSLEALEIAKKRNSLGKSLKTTIPEEVYIKLLEEISKERK